MSRRRQPASLHLIGSRVSLHPVMLCLDLDFLEPSGLANIAIRICVDLVFIQIIAQGGSFKCVFG